MRESFFLFLANLLPRLRISDRYRYILLKLAGFQIYGKPVIWSPVNVSPIGGAKNVIINEGTFINSEVRFGAPSAEISIGRNCAIGPRVSFETVNHGIRWEPEIGRETHAKPIVVEDEVWIGSGAIILQGVTIGRGSIVAAGSVVTTDVPSFVLVGGVPARQIRDIS